MKIKKKNKRKWSRAFSQALIAIWNCWPLSNERYQYCESLNYDILGLLTELNNTQTKFQGRRWICSATAEINKEGKSMDPAAGVVITLSPRMADKVMSEGHVGTRIAWMRIKGPVCNIFFIVVYSPQRKKAEADGTRHHRITEKPATIHPQNRLCGARGRFQLPAATKCARMHRTVVRQKNQIEMVMVTRSSACCENTTCVQWTRILNPRKNAVKASNEDVTQLIFQKGSLKRPTKLDYLYVSNR